MPPSEHLQDACEKADTLVQEALGTTQLQYANLCSVHVASELRSRVDAVRRELGSIGWNNADLNDIDGMRRLTDCYAQLSVLLRRHSAWPERTAIGTHSFAKSLNTKDIRIVGCSAVRTQELREDGNMAGNRRNRTVDGLQIGYTINGKTFPDDRLDQGWCGSREWITQYYQRQGDVNGKKWVEDHVIGKLWHNVETTDYCNETAGNAFTDQHTLTFVSVSNQDNGFFARNGKNRVDFGDIQPNMAAIIEQVEQAKSGICRAILTHLRGATTLAPNGM